MPGEADGHNAGDPMEVWRQWNETTTKMWSSILEGSKEAYTDPYGFSRLWMKSMGTIQDRLQEATEIDPLTIWKQWIDATTDAWKRASEAGKDAVQLSSQWLRVLEETNAKLLSGEINAKDPITFLKQWYDATSETWAQMVGEVMSSERFLEAQRQFIETYTSAVRSSNHLNEELFKTMQLPTRADITNVAGLVVSLEEKVDRIEDALEDTRARFEQASESNTAVDHLEQQLHQLDHKLDTLISTLKEQVKSTPESTQAPTRTRRQPQKKQEEVGKTEKGSISQEHPKTNVR